MIETLRLILNSKLMILIWKFKLEQLNINKFFGQDSTLKRGLLARMPAPPVKQREALTLHICQYYNHQYP